MPNAKPFRLLLAGTAIAALAACSGTPTPPPALTAARAAFGTAANDPSVTQHAALELQQAKATLAKSENLWRGDADADTVRHFAYLAERRAEIAQQTARLKTAEQQVQNADAARAQAVLGARTAEAEQARQRAQQAENRADTLQQQIEKLRADRSGRGAVLTLGDILFDVDGSHLKPGAYDEIGQLAQFLKQHPDRTVTVEGFTDSTGSDAYNRQLSQARADAVRTALLQDGVAPQRVAARGYGESAPVATNETTAGRQLNRRVEVAISDRNGQAPQGSGSSSRGGARARADGGRASLPSSACEGWSGAGELSSGLSGGGFPHPGPPRGVSLNR